MTSNIENVYDVNRHLCVLGPAVGINLREFEYPSPYAGNRWLVKLCRDLYQLQSSEHRQDISLAAGSQLCGTACMRRNLGAEEMPRGCVVVVNVFFDRQESPHRTLVIEGLVHHTLLGLRLPHFSKKASV
jgi:hypothetical protein